MATQVKIFAGTATRYLAEKIAKAYNIELGKLTIARFSDGEMQPCYEETIRGDEIYLVQSTFPPADNLLELLLMIDAAKRASAKQIVVIIPYFGFARQDRKDKPRVSIGSKLVADLLRVAGVTRIVTMDLHADQIQGFFDIPVDHLYASKIFIPYIKSLNLENMAIAAPDTGGTRRAAVYAKILNSDLVISFKQREKANVVEKITIIGDVKDKDVILIDDIADTSNTLSKAACTLMDKGAKSVRGFITHPILSGRAYEIIENSCLTELVVTDTIPLRRESKKIKVLSTAELFADVIHKIHNYESISSHFIV